MRLKDLGDLIVFDTFPLLFEPKQKIVLTHLLHLEEHVFPKQISLIFTTHKLAEQLIKYCEFKKLKCLNKSNIVVVKPNEFIDIVVERRRTLQILFCASEEEESNNVMVLIRENGKLNYIYAGNFVDIRSALLNDTFASWISHGVEKLYVNLKRMDEDSSFNDIDQMQKVFNSVDDIMKCHRDSKIKICLPLFGYEHFILKLAQRFPKRIKYSNLKQFYINILEEDPQIAMNFCKGNDNNSKIVLLSEKLSPYEANTKFKNTREISIVIVNDASKCNYHEISNSNGYYELFYSPEPSPFHLKLLAMLVKPKRIFGIVDTFNNKSVVPNYLYELCVGAKQRIQKKHERKLSDPFYTSNTNKLRKQAATTIIAGALSTKDTHRSGPFLSDSESDSDT